MPRDARLAVVLNQTVEVQGESSGTIRSRAPTDSPGAVDALVIGRGSHHQLRPGAA